MMQKNEGDDFCGYVRKSKEIYVPECKAGGIGQMAVPV